MVDKRILVAAFVLVLVAAFVAFSVNTVNARPAGEWCQASSTECTWEATLYCLMEDPANYQACWRAYYSTCMEPIYLPSCDTIVTPAAQ